MNSQPYTEEAFVEAVSVLGWDVRNDDIRVEIGGTQVSGIDVGEVYNKNGSHLSVLASTIKMHLLLSKIFRDLHLNHLNL